MGDDEYECSSKCVTNSKCKTNADVICIQHPTVDQLCRCVKRGYQLTTDSSSCQG